MLKHLLLRYIGKLLNGKVFDSNTSGQPFYFRLGAGEVIKGWDQGIEGMAVGGERKLTVSCFCSKTFEIVEILSICCFFIQIPAKLAYGSQKLPGLPPNSVLTFDCKLVNVK